MNIIQLSKILFYTSIIVWLFPPVRNFKRKYFLYFVFLAISDPISLLLRKVGLHSRYISIIFIIFCFCYLISVLDKNEIKRYKYLLIFVVLFTLLLNFIVNKQDIVLLTFIIIHWIIFLIFFKHFSTFLINERIISVFYIVLLFYELTIITKFLIILFNAEYATAFFIITSIFQIAFGLFFSIFREDKTSIALKRG